MIKNLALLFLCLAFQVSFVSGQMCGRSVRTIALKFDGSAEPPEMVKYELFYLAPKNTGADYNDYERSTKFLSKFLYDNPDTVKDRFWLGYETENPFVKVPAKKAEEYLKTYKLEDFQDFYTNRWHDNHLPQLKGNFTGGVLRLETRETDITPFIMRVEGENFETLYLLGSFLGGCFNNQPVQTVQVKTIKK